MLGEEDKIRLSGSSTRRTYLRSVSWTDRSPTSPNPRPQPSKARPCLPPLQPLSISRRSVEEWPRAGSDDLGIWPHPPTPGARKGSIKPLANSDSEQPEREFQFKKDKLAFFDKECSRIAEHIYLGSDAVAKNREILRQNCITHVLNCVGFVCPEYFKSDLVYKTLWLQDSPSEDITSILYDVFDYFEDVREQGGRVLVHCCQGVSRSTSLVIAYLMWREGQSFEDAFQYVKAARGVTNPNMGFACQLLQCQKRVLAVPVSPNSMLRMYRMAPHSPYDPLHLVPKMLNHPSESALDSRGAFIVHVPSAIYIWIGKNCSSVMSNNAGAAASQVIRYERAQGSIVLVKEGEEPSEFWDALASGQLLTDGFEKVEVKKGGDLSGRNVEVAAAIRLGVGERKVDEYDQDFEIFCKALAGGVVPPFPLSGTGSETCLPARGNGWGRLRRRFANGIMKGFVTSAKLNCDTTQSNHGSNMIIDTCKEVDCLVPPTDLSSPSTPPCGSSDSFSCSPNSGSDMIRDTCREVEQSVLLPDHLLPASPPCGSPDSFSCYLGSSPKSSSKSPSLSPSTSDYSSSFTFSPSSSNWSDMSYLSSRQPSPSGLESTDLFSAKNVSLAENSCLLSRGTPPSPTKAFSANHAARVAHTCLPCKGTCPSIAERRGSNPPPLMLPSAEKPPQVPRNLVRSCSFSLSDLDDDMMKDVEYNQFEHECNKEEPLLDADVVCAGNESQHEIDNNGKHGNFYFPSHHTTDRVAEVTNSVLYQWPTMNKVEMHGFGILDSRSVYFMFTPDVRLGTNNSFILYVWLGRCFSSEKLQSQLISSDGIDEDSHIHWETVGRNFLNLMDLPVNAPIQVIISSSY
ncbi:hypothetical protein L1049_005726 [Liquidambar formosana]|uniref:Protein-tyrosine-phosphatase MKP1 n=1 Tax=Liquidambar formosana TaxID=63359 RepID=A0AAP0RE94_LIQFO